MSYLDRIANVPTADLSRYLPFRVGGIGVGYITPEFAALLAEYPACFHVTDAGVGLADGLESFAERTAAVHDVLAELSKRGLIRPALGEAYPVAANFADAPLMQLDRAAVAKFGIRAYGVHVNGFVRDGDTLKMWIGRRSADREMSPGKLDQIVAGGQPIGLSLMDNVVKECAEEADIPEELARLSRPIGCVTYTTEFPEGLRRDVLFNYDLEVPAEFVPRNTDGEISEFYLWPMERVMEAVNDTDDFKFNCSLVIIDFLIRHGLIEPDHAECVDLSAGLRR